MDLSYFQATIINLSINLIYTLLTLWLVVMVFLWIDRRIFTKIDFEEEIKNGNIAAAIFVSSLFTFVAIVAGLSMR